MIGTGVHRHRSFSADYSVYYPRVEFTVYLDRKPLFYIVNIIIPVFFLVLVVLMVGLPAVALSRQSLFCVLYFACVCIQLDNALTVTLSLINVSMHRESKNKTPNSC